MTVLGVATMCVRISKTVHKLLNHSESDMRIADRYIECDWAHIYNAHCQVVIIMIGQRLPIVVKYGMLFVVEHK